MDQPASKRNATKDILIAIFIVSISVGFIFLYIGGKFLLAQQTAERKAVQRDELRIAQSQEDPTEWQIIKGLEYARQSLQRAVQRQGNLVYIYTMVGMESGLEGMSPDLKARLLAPKIIEIRFARAYQMECFHGHVAVKFPATEPPIRVGIYGIFPDLSPSYQQAMVPNLMSPAFKKMGKIVCEAVEAEIQDTLR
jgi:hypothetical protein